MANYPQKVHGTAQTWEDSGGSNVLTLASLAAGAGRQGAKSTTFVDGTFGNPVEYLVKLLFQATAAMTDQKEIEVWVGQSSSATAATDNPGGLTGSDAAYTVSRRFQIGFAGAVPASNSIGTGAQQSDEFIIPFKEIYLVPMVFNNADQNFDATAGHHILTITPVYWKIA